VNEVLTSAVQSVPAGPWAIGVSGGADSVALLTLLNTRPDLSLHIVHLNHQTRSQQNTQDALFVTELANRLRLPIVIDDRSHLEGGQQGLPRNPSARYRALRLALFRRVVLEQKLNGVLLAHHADDQAETILHRLIRRSHFSGLAGMSARTVIGGLLCVRPLLKVRRQTLRQWLAERNLPWREDPSNQSFDYLRNCLRILLANDPALSEALLELGEACSGLNRWVESARLRPGPLLEVNAIADQPAILSRATARNWLKDTGVWPAKIEPATIDRLLAMCLDASTASRAQFPGGVTLARRRGKIEKISIT
jgi:tRNA(Ile)-lysidine synthetase-like protein